MEIHCPTCGQGCSREIQDALDSRTLAVMSLFLQKGVSLTKGEARVLAALRGKNRPISRNLLMDQVYGLGPDADYPDDKIIDVWICKLKPKIRKANLPWKIVTHWGLGYELEEEKSGQMLRRTACALMILLPLGQVLASRLL